MTSYILSLVAASLAVALLSILCPEGTGGGIAKHVRLLSSLFLICVLIAPLDEFVGGLRDLANGSFSLPELELPDQSDAEEQMQATLDTASKTYFLESLTLLIAEEFAIETGDLRCTAKWTETDGQAVPSRITVFLSGSAIWKNPTEIEQYVADLLGCECVTAIE